MNRYRYLIAVMACAALVSGCAVEIVSGPTEVEVGAEATYVLELTNRFASGALGPLYVVAQVPADWSLMSNSYAGTSLGSDVAGSGEVVADPGFTGCGLDAPPPADFQRIVLSDGIVEYGGADTATVALDFQSGNVEGTYSLTFWVVAGACDEASIGVLQGISPLEIPTTSQTGQLLLTLVVLVSGLVTLLIRRR